MITEDIILSTCMILLFLSASFSTCQLIHSIKRCIDWLLFTFCVTRKSKTFSNKRAKSLVVLPCVPFTILHHNHGRMSSESPELESLQEIKESKEAEFLPPSVPLEHTFDSTTYSTPIPKVIEQNPTEPCVLGVDEAGRGPVLGPMVYGVAYCLKSFESQLKSKYGFADSKTLNEAKRTSLLEEMCLKDSELFENVGWSTRTMTAMDISSGMLRPHSIGNYNLNEQAHDATMDLIQGILDQGVNLQEIYVDTVGPPASYQVKLQNRFPGIKITVAKKADALYPCVSSASICAKVTRDFSLVTSKNQLYSKDTQWGSGYPSDPKTSRWLNEAVDPIFGWSQVVRFSWQTAKDAIVKNKGVEIEWEEDNIKQDYGNVSDLFGNDTKRESLQSLPVSTLWYAHNVNAF